MGMNVRVGWAKNLPKFILFIFSPQISVRLFVCLFVFYSII